MKYWFILIYTYILSDIVFFIFLYQRYIYRIDPKRVNEFGTSQDMIDGEIMPDEPPCIEPAPDMSSQTTDESNASNGHPPKSADEKKNDWSLVNLHTQKS